MSGLSVHNRFAALPLWESTRAIWRAVGGKRRGRVKKMNTGHALTLPAIRRAARAGLEAIFHKGRRGQCQRDGQPNRRAKNKR